MLLFFFAAAHPLVLVGQRVRSFDSPTGVHVLTVVAVHKLLVGSAQRAHPVTSVGHTGSLLLHKLEIKKIQNPILKEQI